MIFAPFFILGPKARRIISSEAYEVCNFISEHLPHYERKSHLLPRVSVRIGRYMFKLRNVDEKCVLARPFSVAAITKCHKLSGLEHHELVLLKFCRPEVRTWRQRAQVRLLQDIGSFWRLQGKSPFLAFPSFRSLPVFPGL